MIKIDTDIGRVYAKDEVAYDMGEFYVSVTTVLDCVIDSGLKDFFVNNDKKTIERIRESTADAGTKIHELIESDLKGEDVIPSDSQQKAFDLWTSIRANHHIEADHNEVELYHDQLGYCGTADIIGNFTSCDSKKCCFNKINGTAVMDIKTGTYKVQAGWQIAAYRAAAINMGLVDESCGGVGLHVKRDGSEGRPFVMQHLEPCFETFLHCLQVWKFLNFNKLAKKKWKYLKTDAFKEYLNSKETK